VATLQHLWPTIPCLCTQDKKNASTHNTGNTHNTCTHTHTQHTHAHTHAHTHTCNSRNTRSPADALSREPSAAPSQPEQPTLRSHRISAFGGSSTASRMGPEEAAVLAHINAKWVNYPCFIRSLMSVLNITDHKRSKGHFEEGVRLCASRTGPGGKGCCCCCCCPCGLAVAGVQWPH